MISAKDVYEACVGKEVSDEEWGLIPHSHDFYACIANRINTQHIAPLLEQMTGLQGLVRDYVEFAKFDAPTVRKWANEWRAERDKLAERAKPLVGEAEP